MTDVRAATEEFLAEKPDLEGELEELLAVDADTETWTFDEISLGSGAFGELVSRGIVEKHEDEYRIRDREAVEQVLGLNGGTGESANSTDIREMPSFSLPDIQIDRAASVGLAGALALVVLFRVLPYGSVFRNGDVVLSGNDPYAYRYLVHQMLAESEGVLDFSVLSSLPREISHGEPLLVATLWWASALFGGGADYVLVVYPVVGAIVSALLVYVITVKVAEDKRVGIAAVALLAIMPAHAFRTGLGFADHHAFDYPWLALTALAVVALVTNERDPRDVSTWIWALALGVGVGGQTLAWDAGPLLLVPLALFAVAVVPSWLRDGRNPLLEGLPLLGGLAVGAMLAGGTHVTFGWHSIEVAIAPTLLFGGVLGVFALGTIAQQFDTSTRAFVGIELVGVIVGLFSIRTLIPSFAGRLDDGIDFLFQTEGIAETASLVSGQLGNIVAPVFLFGFVLFLAVPYLAWASWWSYRQHAPAWLAVSCYGWYFLALALVQIRFAGQLALFTALFGGLGFVHLAAWVDLAAYPRPFRSVESEQMDWSNDEDSDGEDNGLESLERREALYTAGLGLGVGSLGMVMTPIKHGQLTIDDSIYEAARFMREYSDKQKWTYPENYVLSRWGRNRVYNWFVNGESQSYGYAFSNFEDFVASTDGQEWYERLRDRVGFVVIDDQLPIDTGGETVYEQLWADNFGLDTDHYRAVWHAEDDSRRVYTLVPGARVTGPTENEEASISGEITLAHSAEEIDQSIDIAHGVYDETIPLPGRYEIAGQSVEVFESDVTGGKFLSGFNAEATAHWSLSEGEGEWAYDRAGGRHAQLQDAEWGERGVEVADEGYLQARSVGGHTISAFTISAWIRPEDGSSGAILSFGKDGGSDSLHGILFDHGLSGWNDDRLGLYLGDGEQSNSENSPKLDFSYPAEEYHHIGIVFDSGDVRWFVDGEIRSEESIQITEVSFADGRATYLGREYSGYGGVHSFQGGIDDVQYYERALSAPDIRSL